MKIGVYHNFYSNIKQHYQSIKDKIDWVVSNRIVEEGIMIFFINKHKLYIELKGYISIYTHG